MSDPKTTHTAEITCGDCGYQVTIALGMAHAIACGGCDTTIVLGEDDREPRYQIESARTGLVLGVYEAASEDDALDAMARDAGYSDYADALRVAPSAGLIVTELHNE